MVEKALALNQNITSRFPEIFTRCNALHRLWKQARRTKRARKKTGAKEHRLCQDSPYQMATGALMPGCGS